MAKRNRKTRRDKKIADNRHVLHHLEVNTAQVSNPIEKKPKVTEIKAQQNPSKQTVSLSYVATDIKKITFISSILIATQIVLYLVLNNRI